MSDKDKKKREKQILQQQKSNVIYDRKARPFYVNPQEEKYYRLKSTEEKVFYLYDAKYLFAILPVLLSELAFRDKIYWALVLTVVIHVGFEFYYRHTLSKLNISNNPPQEVVSTFHSLAVLKAKRSDGLLKLALGVVMSIMVFSNPNSFDIIKSKGILQTLANLVPYLAMALTLLPAYDLVITNKLIRKIKKD